MHKFIWALIAICLPYITFGQVVVVAPHPDDEVLGAAERIDELLQQGHEVYVVYVTDGEAKDLQDVDGNLLYGEIRRNESLEAMRQLGVPEANIIMLGFPDQGIDKLTHATYFSPFTNTSVAHEWSRYPGLRYTRNLLKNALRVVISHTNAHTVYYTSPHDKHDDHSAVGWLMRELVSETDVLAYEYIIHQHKNKAPIIPNKDSKKLALIRLFLSQFHDTYHQQYLEQFAAKPEVFVHYVPLKNKVVSIR